MLTHDCPFLMQLCFNQCPQGFENEFVGESSSQDPTICDGTNNGSPRSTPRQRASSTSLTPHVSMLSVLAFLGLVVLASLSNVSEGQPWRVVLTEALDGCPCKVHLGGMVTSNPRIATEIVSRNVYTKWVADGRPNRLANITLGNPALFGNASATPSPEPFCFEAEKNAIGDYDLLVYYSGDIPIDVKLTDIARRSCPNKQSIDDYDDKDDRNECDSSLTAMPSPDVDYMTPAPIPMVGETQMEPSAGPMVPSSTNLSLTPAGRIIHGRLVRSKEIAAYNVKITELQEHDHIEEEVELCTGSLIAPLYVLTAAHCNVTVGQSVFIGGYLNYKGENHTVVKSIPHPEYLELKPEHDNRIGTELHDIRVLELEAPVTGASERMVSINRDCHRPVPCRTALVSGYGESAEDTCGKNALRSTFVNIVDHDTCHKLLKDAHEGLVEHCLDESPHICATHDLCGAGLCHGDSGGPLVIADKDTREVVQVGISSFIVGECGARDHPDVYTRVSAYWEWIAMETHSTVRFSGTVRNDCPIPETNHQCDHNGSTIISVAGNTGNGSDPIHGDLFGGED